jgi:cytochrome c-type biogenesis protein CcmE
MWIVAGVAALGVATALVLNAFQSNMVFYLTPTQIASNEAPRDRAFRVGGLVEEGSLVREKDALTVRFKVTDTARTIPVVYTGILPDLFKEGKGVIAQGRVGADGTFRATEVLAKHDENYMPPAAADAVKKAQQAQQQKGYK